MTNDDNPRRNRDRLEDNPFIAFRRFADSQVSSLLNTVFTLPATIANHNNAHQAREACLFNKAEKSQCDKLREIENDIAELRHEGRELYRVGDLQEVLKKSEELMRLDRRADDLRREIVGESSQGSSGNGDTELVQKVANRKGQEWGWDWSWGFPKPFDDDDQWPSARQAMENENRRQSIERSRELMQRMHAEVREVFGDDVMAQALDTVERMVNQHPFLRSLVTEEDWEEVRKLRQSDPAEREDARRAARQDAVRSFRARPNGSYPKRVPWASEETNDEPSYEYSHDHEDQHDDPPTPKVGNEGFIAAAKRSMHDYDEAAAADAERRLLQEQAPMDRYIRLRDCPRPGTTGQEREDISRYLQEEAENNGRGLDFGTFPRSETTSQEREDISKLLQDQQEDSGWYAAIRDCPRSNTMNDERADIEKYLQEQQEQNGRSFAFGQAAQRDENVDEDNSAAETELDVYEHVLDKPQPPQQPAKPNMQASILSTLTTTERSVAPDGSVTTKVVLKKRFADGREESSETVHTQRGQDQGEPRDPWAAFQMSMTPRDAAKREEQTKENETKKGGWFWSN